MTALCECSHAKSSLDCDISAAFFSQKGCSLVVLLFSYMQAPVMEPVLGCKKMDTYTPGAASSISVAGTK